MNASWTGLWWGSWRSGESVAEGSAVPEVGFAVGAAPVAARIPARTPHVTQQLPCPLSRQLRDCLRVDAWLRPIQLGQAGHDPVPPQQLHEPSLVDPLRRDTDLIHELVHGRTR